METISSHSQGSNSRVALDQALLASVPIAEKKSSQEDYRIRIPSFEGPLDLLLHLIRKEQLNIYDIPIAHICKSYHDHLNRMREFDFNVAGEFMVMAATLTYLKSVLLLPREESENVEDDPRYPLVQMLLEYEKFKLAATQLDARPWLGRDTYIRPPGTAQDIMPVESLLDAPIEAIDTFQLLVCLKRVTSKHAQAPLKFEGDAISIRDKVAVLSQLLESQQVIQFEQLLPETPKASDIIVAFLATLEMAKLKFIEIIQHENYGPIQIRGVRAISDLDAGLLETY